MSSEIYRKAILCDFDNVRVSDEQLSKRLNDKLAHHRNFLRTSAGQEVVEGLIGFALDGMDAIDRYLRFGYLFSALLPYWEKSGEDRTSYCSAHFSLRPVPPVWSHYENVDNLYKLARVRLPALYFDEDVRKKIEAELKWHVKRQTSSRCPFWIVPELTLVQDLALLGWLDRNWTHNHLEKYLIFFLAGRGYPKEALIKLGSKLKPELIGGTGQNSLYDRVLSKISDDLAAIKGFKRTYS